MDLQEGHPVMALKQHCDVCDAVIPDDQEWVYVVPKGDFHNRDWRYGRDVPQVCMPCIATTILDPHVQRVIEDIKKQREAAIKSAKSQGQQISAVRP